MGTFQIIKIGQRPSPQTQEKSPEISEGKRAKVTNLATIRQRQDLQSKTLTQDVQERPQNKTARAQKMNEFPANPADCAVLDLPFNLSRHGASGPVSD